MVYRPTMWAMSFPQSPKESLSELFALALDVFTNVCSNVFVLQIELKYFCDYLMQQLMVGKRMNDITYL